MTIFRLFFIYFSNELKKIKHTVKNDAHFAFARIANDKGVRIKAIKGIENPLRHLLLFRCGAGLSISIFAGVVLFSQVHNRREGWPSTIALKAGSAL